ncbi:hypothetical protein AWP65_12015 [Escherichia coli]|nr:hypothetical protein AWP65_12015 [Escherichia coli]
MQCAENVPDAFFRFTPGKTSLFAVFAAESRSARFSGARKGCYVQFSSVYWAVYSNRCNVL